MKRAAIYIRMSTEKQEDSPGRQRDFIQPYCEKKGYTVVGEYADLGRRGWDGSRPDFQRLLRDAQSGLFQVIVVDNSARLSRQNPLEYMATVAYPLKQAGVIIDSVAEGERDPSELGGLIVMTVGQEQNSKYCQTLASDTAKGQVSKAREGKLFPGRAPYGLKYKFEDGRRVGYEFADPERVRVVRLMFDGYLNRDLSLMALVAELNALRIPTPMGGERWGTTTVHNILRNHVYAGCYVWGKAAQGSSSAL